MRRLKMGPAAAGSALCLLVAISGCGSDEDGANGGASAGGGTGGTAGSNDGAGGTSGTNGAGGSGGSSGSSGGSAGAGAAAGNAGSSGGGPADAGNSDGAACGSLGAGCDVSCAGDHECFQGVCIPESRPMCGGFAGAECPETFPVCLFCNGCDFGPCFRQSEVACVCRGTGRSVLDCR